MGAGEVCGLLMDGLLRWICGAGKLLCAAGN
jgi:hypothetical protein